MARFSDLFKLTTKGVAPIKPTSKDIAPTFKTAISATPDTSTTQIPTFAERIQGTIGDIKSSITPSGLLPKPIYVKDPYGLYETAPTWGISGEGGAEVPTMPQYPAPTQIDYNLMTTVYDLLERMKFGANYNPKLYGLVYNGELENSVNALLEGQTLDQRRKAYANLKGAGLDDDQIYAIANFQTQYGKDWSSKAEGGSFFNSYFNAPNAGVFFQDYLQNLESQFTPEGETIPGTTTAGEGGIAPTTGLVSDILGGEEQINRLYDIARQNVTGEVEDWWNQMSKEAERRLLGRNIYGGGIAEQNFANLGRQGSEALAKAGSTIESQRAQALADLPYRQVGALEPIRQFEVTSQYPLWEMYYNLQNVPYGQTTSTTQTTPGGDPLAGFLQGYTAGTQLGGLFGGSKAPATTASLSSTTPSSVTNYMPSTYTPYIPQYATLSPGQSSLTGWLPPAYIP